MNTPTPPCTLAETSLIPTCTKSITQLETCVRKHPGSTLLIAAGLGVIAVLVGRALTPAPPRSRSMQLLEDIQDRLAELAKNGAHAVNNGVDSLGDLHLDRKLDKVSRGFKGLFQ